MRRLAAALVLLAAAAPAPAAAQFARWSQDQNATDAGGTPHELYGLKAPTHSSGAPRVSDLAPGACIPKSPGLNTLPFICSLSGTDYLAPIGTAAGNYDRVSVASSGLVTGGATMVAANVTALEALAGANYRDGQRVYVQSVAADFVLRTSSTATVDHLVVASVSGSAGARWLRDENGKRTWWEPTTYYVKNDTGSDEADCLTSGTPCATATEVGRRLRGREVTGTVTLNALADLPDTDIPTFDTSPTGLGSGIVIQGTQTVLATGTIASVVAPNYGANILNEGTITGFNPATYVGYLVRKGGTSGATGTYSAIVANPSSQVARFGMFTVNGSTSAAGFVNGDTVEVIQGTRFPGAHILGGVSGMTLNDVTLAKSVAASVSLQSRSGGSFSVNRTTIAPGLSLAVTGGFSAVTSVWRASTGASVSGVVSFSKVSLVNLGGTINAGSYVSSSLFDVVAYGTGKFTAGDRAKITIGGSIGSGVFGLTASQRYIVGGTGGTIQNNALLFGNYNDPASFVLALERDGGLVGNYPNTGFIPENTSAGMNVGPAPGADPSQDAIPWANMSQGMMSPLARGGFGPTLAVATNLPVQGLSMFDEYSVTGTGTVNTVSVAPISNGVSRLFNGSDAEFFVATGPITFVNAAGVPPSGYAPLATADGANATLTAGQHIRFRYHYSGASAGTWTEVSRFPNVGAYTGLTATQIGFGSATNTLTGTSTFWRDATNGTIVSGLATNPFPTHSALHVARSTNADAEMNLSNASTGSTASSSISAIVGSNDGSTGSTISLGTAGANNTTFPGALAVGSTGYVWHQPLSVGAPLVLWNAGNTTGSDVVLATTSSGTARLTVASSTGFVAIGTTPGQTALAPLHVERASTSSNVAQFINTGANGARISIGNDIGRALGSATITLNASTFAGVSPDGPGPEALYFATRIGGGGTAAASGGLYFGLSATQSQWKAAIIGQTSSLSQFWLKSPPAATNSITEVGLINDSAGASRASIYYNGSTGGGLTGLTANGMFVQNPLGDINLIASTGGLHNSSSMTSVGLRIAHIAAGGVSSTIQGGSLATTATDGFLYQSSMAGPPSASPTAQTGTVPGVYDSTNFRYYARLDGGWAPIAQDTRASDGWMKSVSGIWTRSATIPYADISGAPSAITALTGDGTASGPGSAPLTLATVNASPGTYAYATVVVNGKGLATTVTAGATPALGSRTLTAGAGMTGGGTLAADRTFDVIANADGTIVVNADDIQAGVMQTANIAADAITNLKLANMTAPAFKGRTTAGTGDPEDLTATQATAMLNVFDATHKGLTPAGTGAAGTFLAVDGTWGVPAGTGGGGSVTVVTATAPFVITSTPTTTPNVTTSVLTDTLLGRDTAGTGVVEQLAVGGGLEFTGGPGIQRSHISGDLDIPAGSNTSTLATVNASPGTYAYATVTVNGKGLGTTVVAGATPALATQHLFTSQAEAGLTNEVNFGGFGNGVLMQSVTAGVSTPTTYSVGGAEVPFGSGTTGFITSLPNMKLNGQTFGLGSIQELQVYNASTSATALAGFRIGTDSSFTNAVAFSMLGTNWSSGGLAANAALFELNASTAPFIFSNYNGGKISFTTGTSRTERAAILASGSITASSLSSGGIMYATSPNGTISSTPITAGSFVIANGASGIPYAGSRFAYDSVHDIVEVSDDATQAWYSTGTGGAGNYERLYLSHPSSVWTIKSEAAGTGTVRPIAINASTAPLTLSGSEVRVSTLPGGPGYVATDSTVGTGQLLNVTPTSEFNYFIEVFSGSTLPALNLADQYISTSSNTDVFGSTAVEYPVGKTVPSYVYTEVCLVGANTITSGEVDVTARVNGSSVGVGLVFTSASTGCQRGAGTNFGGAATDKVGVQLYQSTGIFGRQTATMSGTLRLAIKVRFSPVPL